MKFLKGDFFKSSGVSYVTIADKYGKYTGYATLHDDDKEFASKFTGCRLAEQRAYIRLLEANIKRNKIMLKAIRDLKKDMELNCKDINPAILRRINLKLRDYSKEIAYNKDKIAEIKTNIKKSIEIKDNINKRSKEIKEDK